MRLIRKTLRVSDLGSFRTVQDISSPGCSRLFPSQNDLFSEPEGEFISNSADAGSLFVSSFRNLTYDSQPSRDVGSNSRSRIRYILYIPVAATIMLKKDLTVREHLKTIQSDGGKARWAKLTPEERSAQARKIVAARWAKKVISEIPIAVPGATKPKKAAPNTTQADI